MLERLTPQPPDKIIELMGLFAADPREDKLDLGVGVYKDADGRTPVMRAVKEAEARLHAEQATKAYVGLLGDLEFVRAMAALVFADAVPASRIAGAQTPGGTGAIRQLLELVRRASPAATVWHSDPTWPNHPAILAYLGIPSRTYRYFDAATRNVDIAGMNADLAAARPGDVVLLHGCCHNPTGANLTFEDWRTVTDLALRAGLVPLIDLAYQGFGDGLDADAAGLRHMAAAVPELLLAASCSKNFGLYRERVGAAFVIAPDTARAEVAQANLAALNRLNYSFPPDHGAKLVQMILADPGLRRDWAEELEAMRTGMLALRRGFAEALRRATNSDRFDFVAEHRGMFSRLGASPEQVGALRREHGVYLVGDSRLNVAGLPADGLDRLARAIAAVGDLMPVPYITAADVEGRLDWLTVADALAEGHRGPRARITDQLLTRGADTMLSRAAWIDGLGIAVKSVSVLPANPARGLPSVHGALVLFDDATGAVRAVIDAGLVTRWKTAGDSLLGARLLARADSRRLLILGAGAVAESLVEAYRALFPAIDVAIWNRTPGHAQALAARTGAREAAELAAEVRAADIVAAATMATEPLIAGDWLRPGQHLDLIGAFRPDMREADDAALRRARIFVDSVETTLDHIGELKDPLARGVIARADVLGDLHDLVAGRVGRGSPDEITLFKNGGGAHLDLMAGRVILAACEAFSR